MTNKANKENKRKKKKEKRLPARAAPKARQDRRCVGKELDAPNTRRSSSSGLRPFSRLCSRDRDSNRGPATEPAPTSHGRAARSELMPAPEQGQASHCVVAKNEETTQKAVELAAIQLASVMATGRSRAERRAAGKALQCLTMMRNDQEHLETAVPPEPASPSGFATPRAASGETQTGAQFFNLSTPPATPFFKELPVDELPPFPAGPCHGKSAHMREQGFVDALEAFGRNPSEAAWLHLRAAAPPGGVDALDAFRAALLAGELPHLHP